MHRGHGFVEDDALISLFRRVLIQANAGDWSEVARKIQTLDPQLDRYHTCSTWTRRQTPALDCPADANSTARYLAGGCLSRCEKSSVIADHKMRDDGW
jgi:hypothetical protein